MENNSIDVTTNSLRNLRKNKTKSIIIKGFIYLMAFITLAVLFYLIIYMLVNGIPHLKPSMFSNHYTSKNVSMMPSIKTTVLLVLLTLLIASPIGIFTAIYLSEYSKKTCNRNIIWYSINCLWFIRYVVIRYEIKVQVFVDIWCSYNVHNGASINN